MKKRRWKRSKNSVQRDRQADADSFPFHSSANTPSHKKEEAKPSITSSATHASRRGSIRPVQGAQAIHGRLSARRPAGHATAAFPIPRNKAMTEAAAMATAVEETEAVQGSSVGSGPVSFLPMPPIASEAARARASMMLKRRKTATTPKLPRPL